MPSGREQGQLYLYYASSCLPVLGRVVCYGKTIFLTEWRVLRDPHGFLFGISFLRISESLPSPKDIHVAFGQNGQIKGLSVRSISRPGFPPPILSLTFKVILPLVPTTANLLWTGLQENRSLIPDISRHLTVFCRVQKFPGQTRPHMQCASGRLCQELMDRDVKLRIHLCPIQGSRKRGFLPPSSPVHLYHGA